MVERHAVNVDAAGSNPALGALSIRSGTRHKLMQVRDAIYHEEDNDDIMKVVTKITSLQT